MPGFAGCSGVLGFASCSRTGPSTVTGSCLAPMGDPPMTSSSSS